MVTKLGGALIPKIETGPFASNNKAKNQSVLKRYCNTGSYWGVVPLKLASGKLLWPDVIVAKDGLIVTKDGIVAANDTSSLRRDIGGEQ